MSYYSGGAELGGTGLYECGAWVTAPGTRYGPHAFDPEHSVFWILDGSAVVREAGRTFEIRPNAVSCTPPGAKHTVEWDARRATRFGYATFIETRGIEYPRTRGFTADDIVIPLLNHVVALSIEKPGRWQESAKAAFDYALRAYRSGESWTHVGIDGAYSDLVTRTLAAVRQHWFTRPMRTPLLPELAAELGITPRHLCRAFERELGMGPISVFRTARILYGAQLLTETTRPIREISELLGFSNPYHFASVFKATLGVPPGEYRSQSPSTTIVSPQIVRLLHHLV